MKKILIIILVLSLLIISGCSSYSSYTPSNYANEQTESSKYICSYNAYNCDDFNTQAKAQEVMNYCGGRYKDIHYLDGDDDGIACETLP